MSEIRDMATRLTLRAAYEMAEDNESDLSAVFDCQHGFIDELRRRAMCMLDDNCPPPVADEMERLIGESGLSMDMLDRRARETYGRPYSTVSERYLCAIGWCIDDMLGENA
ncbi:hypothetical protein [Bifidobacterium sp. SO1]|uniref:hypothetical protein n=1 Tax=Bifidobacterium sp. SO1 TaxID=2809029 RepID=UPI001BDD0EB7|nr:hypothetical protein [Bifidobacterium sp. SO1]MBT1161235.1 hypothetical protein [Bifidobacterium sp. SO1]